jgi:hypothetical protein
MDDEVDAVVDGAVRETPRVKIVVRTPAVTGAWFNPVL